MSNCQLVLSLILSFKGFGGHRQNTLEIFYVSYLVYLSVMNSVFHTFKVILSGSQLMLFNCDDDTSKPNLCAAEGHKLSQTAAHVFNESSPCLEHVAVPYFAAHNAQVTHRARNSFTCHYIGKFTCVGRMVDAYQKIVCTQ